MNVKSPLALASTAVLTLALSACAHTDTNNAAGMTQLAPSTPAAAASGQSSTSTGTATSTRDTSGHMNHAGQHGAQTSASASAGSPPIHAPGGPLVINSPTEALALMATVDQMEIQLSQQARSKKVTGPVMEYADMMIAQHTPHLAQTRAMLEKMGGKPADTGTMQKLMASGKVSQDRLAALEGDAYARAYIEHMVASHQHALAMVDASMGIATDPAVRDFMTKTRQALQMHLERAQQIQGQLGG